MGSPRCPDQVALADGGAAYTPRGPRRHRGRVAVVFSVLFIWYSRNTGEEAAWKVWLPFIFCGGAFLLGIPVYLAQRARWRRRRRCRRNEVPTTR